MEIVLRKRLKPSGKERHWIVIPLASRGSFPPCNVTFKIRIGSETISTYIDSCNRIQLGSTVFGKFELDTPNAAIVLGKSNNEYTMRKEEA